MDEVVFCCEGRVRDARDGVSDAGATGHCPIDLSDSGILADGAR